MPITEWHPIEDLPEELRAYSNPDLQALVQSWQERLQQQAYNMEDQAQKRLYSLAFPESGG